MSRARAVLRYAFVAILTVPAVAHADEPISDPAADERPHMRSPGAVAGGVVLTSVGALAMGVGAVTMAAASNSEFGASSVAFGGMALGGGALLVGGGIPLMVWGARDQEIAAAPWPPWAAGTPGSGSSGSGRVALGPGGLTVAGTF